MESLFLLCIILLVILSHTFLTYHLTSYSLLYFENHGIINLAVFRDEVFVDYKSTVLNLYYRTRINYSQSIKSATIFSLEIFKLMYINNSFLYRTKHEVDA